MIRRPPRSTQSRSSAASDVYKRQHRDLTGKSIGSPSNLRPMEPVFLRRAIVRCGWYLRSASTCTPRSFSPTTAFSWRLRSVSAWSSRLRATTRGRAGLGKNSILCPIITSPPGSCPSSLATSSTDSCSDNSTSPTNATVTWSWSLANSLTPWMSASWACARRTVGNSAFGSGTARKSRSRANAIEPPPRGAAASVRRSLLGGVEPITSLHEVVHPTHHRQYDCNPKQARCQPTRIQDHRDYGHHLAGCLCLSPLARRDDHVLGGSYHAQTGHSELSSYYHHSNPCGHVAEVHQGDQRRRDQELVGQGIQKRSQHRSLASATGEIAVQRIGCRSDGEGDNCEHIPAWQRPQ